jgi:PGF-CTERM protein
VTLYRKVGKIQEGTRITANYGPKEFELRAAGIHLLAVMPGGETVRLDTDNDGSRGGGAEQNGTLTGTVPRNLPDGSQVVVKLVVWPGETTVWLESIDFEVSDEADTSAGSTSTPTPTTEAPNKERHLRITKDVQGVSDGEVTYQFSVSGDLKPGEKAENGEVPNSASAEGRMGPTSGTDDFYFTGEITGFEPQGDAVVYLNGEQIDPSTIADVKKSSKSSQTPTIDGGDSENSDQSGEDVDIEANGSDEGIDVSVDGPGFGFPASIAALLVVAYFFIRRT